MTRLLLHALLITAPWLAQSQIHQAPFLINPYPSGPGTQPILFLDLSAGHAFGVAGGFTMGIAAHYQTGGHLLSVRYVGTLRSKDLIIVFPVIHSSLNELGILYGRRWIWEGSSLGMSAGISHNWFTEQFKSSPTQTAYSNSRAVGIPFEVSLKFFKKKRSRYKSFLIIPVGAPTAFGRSVGFKLIGNLARNGYLGFGVSLGWGYQKKYYPNNTRVN